MLIKNHLFILLTIVCISNTQAQVKGCTDRQAKNYNSQATENDGSCLYNNTSYSSKIICPKLSDTLIESSGLIYFDNCFWTLNDSDNPPMLYAFDSLKGYIKKSIYIKNARNTDWEDLSQDKDYLYIGDFGNNNGNRKDLNILKIKKSALKSSKLIDSVDAEKIRFSLNDQTTFNNSSQNHNFDLEAMCLLGDSIHLFSKNWVDKKSRHYICPRDTGYYALDPVETLEVNGLITGACVQNNAHVTLCGYNSNGLSFIYLMWDYRNHLFLSGNRRRIELGTVITTGQNEAVCVKDKSLYMSNEKQIPNAQLQRIETQLWLKTYAEIQNKTLIKVYSANKVLNIENTTNEAIGKMRVLDPTGKTIYELVSDKSQIKLDISTWAAGIYSIEIENVGSKKFYIQ